MSQPRLGDLFHLALALSVVVMAFSFGASAIPAGAAQLMANGDFEAAGSWSGQRFSLSGGCTPRNGSGAATLTPDAMGPATIQQSVPVNGGAGPFTLSGYAKLQSGSATVAPVIRWLNASSALVLTTAADVTPGGSYVAFTTVPTTAPLQAVTAQIRVTATAASSATVCLDDLAFDGPIYLTPTPTFTPSPTQSPTPPLPAATSTPSPQPTATSTPLATRTPSPTRTPDSASATAPSGPAAGSGSTASGGDFVNGGFEAGLIGWLKFGGELKTVASPAHGGSSAGALMSATTSTKWAYQTVKVSPGRTYAFQGYLLAGGGVEEAYLRISWYGSADASGRTLGSVDSTDRAGNSATAYRFLTTGSVEAPGEARSARVRVMLAPTGTGSATLFMDDLDFGLGAAAPRAAPLLAAGEVLAEDPAPAPAAPAGASPGAVARTASAPGLAVATATTSAALPSASQTAPGPADAVEGARDVRERPRSPAVWILLGAGLFSGGFGAVYVIARRRRSNSA